MRISRQRGSWGSPSRGRRKREKKFAKEEGRTFCRDSEDYGSVSRGRGYSQLFLGGGEMGDFYVIFSSILIYNFEFSLYILQV